MEITISYQKASPEVTGVLFVCLAFLPRRDVENRPFHPISGPREAISAYSSSLGCLQTNNTSYRGK